MLDGRRPRAFGRRPLLVALAAAASSVVGCGSEDEAPESGARTAKQASGDAIVRGISPTGAEYELTLGSPEKILPGDTRVSAGPGGALCVGVEYGGDRTRVCGGKGFEGDSVMNVLPAGFKQAVVILAVVKDPVAEVSARVLGGKGAPVAAVPALDGRDRIVHLAVPLVSRSPAGKRSGGPVAVEVRALDGGGEVIERQVLQGEPTP